MLKHQKKNKYNFFYITDYTYPQGSAHSLQSINMFTALSKYFNKSYLFVNYLSMSLTDLTRYYGLIDKPNIISFRTNRWFLIRSGKAIHFIRNFIMYLIVFFTLIISRNKLLLFVRSKSQFYFWGKASKFLPFRIKYKIIFEAHDVFMFKEMEDSKNLNFEIDYDLKYFKKSMNYLERFDYIICVPDEVYNILNSNKNLKNKLFVLQNVSGIKRSKNFRKINISQNNLILGYFGSIDSADGIVDLFNSFKNLGQNYSLVLAGRIKSDFLDQFNYLKEEADALNANISYIGSKPYYQMKSNMNICDILLSTSGDSFYAKNLRSPIKNYDYMVMGKPIIAADCPANRKIFADNVNSLFYKLGDAGSLTDSIQELGRNNDLANKIAHNAWKDSIHFNYDSRARKLIDFLKLVEN
jgi:glycosyltransferase involved in cell wall biosynthesis